MREILAVPTILLKVEALTPEPEDEWLPDLTEENIMSNITRNDALEIARHHIGRETRIFKITIALPSNCHIYSTPQMKDCWFILCDRGDRYDGLMLRSDRLICVSQSTGEIVYDGSAGDEG